MNTARSLLRAASALCAAFFPLAGSLPAQAPAPLGVSAPRPPSDATLAELVALLQGGDPAARGSFLARTLTDRARAADSTRIDRLLARLHEQGAPYEVLPPDRGGRHVFARLRSARAGCVVTLQVSADRADPTRLDNVDVLKSQAAVVDSIAWPAGRLGGEKEVVAVIERNLDRLAAAGVLSGTVYVARGDSVLFARGYGLADRENGIPNTLRTRFALASMGKMFTATAVLQLVDAGKLRLDDTLARVLPAYPSAERASRITVRQLLEHTAGLGDMWSTPKRPVPGLAGQLAAVAAVAHAPLLFEPGTRWQYSNEGYNVLAAIVEQVSGETFHDYLRRHVFMPAGMAETVLAGGVDDLVPHRAVGYRPRVDDPLGIDTPRANWSFVGSGGAGGAGGGYSTVADLARFGRALRTGKLLSPALRDSMWVGRWPIPGYEGERYGLGSFVGSFGGRVAVGHGGGGTGSGIDNGFRQFTDGSYTVVVLTNVDPPGATDITAALVRFLAAQTPAR